MPREIRTALVALVLGVFSVFCVAQAAPGQPAPGTYNIQAGPVIQNLMPTSAQIWWHADQNAPTQVKYGLSPSSLDQTATSQGSGTPNQTVQLSNLQPGKKYYYTVQKPDGTAAAQADFTTPSPEAATAKNVRIVVGPSIEYVGHNHAMIAWSTTAPASSVVKYGTDPNNLNKTAQAPWGSTTHRVDIKNLQPNTQYYFKVVSSQAQGTGTMAEGGEGLFRTVGQGQQALVLSAPAHP